MSDETEVIQTGEGPTVVLSTGSKEPINIFEATRELRKAREQAYGGGELPETTAEGSADPGVRTTVETSAPPPQSETPPQAEDAAPPEEAPSEQPTEAVEAEPELPPVDPPRSWTREDKDWFSTLPRETAERIAERERLREQDFSRRQQKAAEQERALEASRAEADRARTQFESAVRDTVATLQSQLAGEFSDIKTFDDLEKLAKEDPFRAIQYNIHTQKLQQAQAVLAQADAQRRQEVANFWKNYSTKEDQKFAERAPEMSDPNKVKSLRASVMRTLNDVGFTDEEVQAAWRGGFNPTTGAFDQASGISLRDHRAQLILRKAALWDMAEAKTKTIAAKRAQVPPVQKPGTIRPRGIDAENEIASLEKQLETLSGERAMRVATRLTNLKRAAGQL